MTVSLWLFLRSCISAMIDSLDPFSPAPLSDRNMSGSRWGFKTNSKEVLLGQDYQLVASSVFYL